MTLQKSIKQILEDKSNNYSSLEPFYDISPISSSIVIPVYNNLKIFAKTLVNLSSHPEIKSHPDNFEVTIVNDGSSENIDSIMMDVNFPCPLKCITYFENRGRSYARNQGINASSKDILFFFDADILLPEDYFSKMWKIHNSSDYVLAVGFAENITFEEGQLKNPIANNVAPNLRDDFRYHKIFIEGKFDREEYRLVKETKGFKNFGNGRKIGPWTLPKMAVGHNMSARLKNIRAVGGFDERFRTWGYEDAHLGAKLIARGCYLIPSRDTGVIRILEESNKKEFRDENLELYEKIIESEYL